MPKLQHLISALQFLTVLRLGKDTVFAPRQMIPYFPAVGLIVGALVSVADHLAGKLWSTPVASLMDVVFLVVVTGAFHLDGLADSADGLFSHRSRERMLEIMKDSRIGTMGLVAVAVCLMLKWAGLTGIENSRSAVITIIPAMARCSTLIAVRLLPYGRGDSGTGYPFFGSPLPVSAFAGMVPPLVLALLLGWLGIGLIAVFLLSTAGGLLFFQRRLGCITGDMLGALVEVNETTLFLAAAVEMFP